jgi:hypothetical protein
MADLLKIDVSASHFSIYSHSWQEYDTQFEGDDAVVTSHTTVWLPGKVVGDT